MPQPCPKNLTDASVEHFLEATETYANLSTLERETVDFVRGLFGREEAAARGFLRLMTQVGVEEFDENDMQVLQLVVDNVATKKADAFKPEPVGRVTVSGTCADGTQVSIEVPAECREEAEATLRRLTSEAPAEDGPES